jgi:hypothetical protein
MKKIYIITIIAAFTLALLHFDVSAQFEQKFTLNFSVGGAFPFGEEDYVGYHRESFRNYYGEIEEKHLVTLDPYIMSNFFTGGSFTAGVQYNINRRLSIGGNIGFYTMWDWYYAVEYYDFYQQKEVETSFNEWHIFNPENPGEVIASGEDQFNLYNLWIGFFSKYHILPGRTINPYLFAEVSGNYTDLQFVNKRQETLDELDLTPDEFVYDPSFDQMLEQSFGLGLYPGLGFDIRISENIGLFFQGGYSMIILNKDDLDEAKLEPENLTTIRVDIGAKISFLKSKNL